MNGEFFDSNDEVSKNAEEKKKAEQRKKLLMAYAQVNGQSSAKVYGMMFLP